MGSEAFPLCHPRHARVYLILQGAVIQAMYVLYRQAFTHCLVSGCWTRHTKTVRCSGVRGGLGWVDELGLLGAQHENSSANQAFNGLRDIERK